ncbi:hypothetical protein ANCCAN_04922 [Ancylostoma caninum]|uniref:Uncharacterized protein n=1 Tax=Ancylostoma caninum TaxID=29170 RepID=A0A368H192_ANCCA|nr:hypothetical protein ANCCAN_04922 [Ancylostoma caninum]
MSYPALITAKQRLTRHFNDIKHLIADWDKFKEGWKFPTAPKELYVFIRTQRSVVSEVIRKLETKIEAVTTIYGETIAHIDSMVVENKDLSKQDFEKYWLDKEGAITIETSCELIQSLEMRLTELAMQEMQVTYSDEYDNMEQQLSRAAANPESRSFAHGIFSPSFDASRNTAEIPAHWYKNELRILEFHGNPTEFESFWEIFSGLVHKQPYSDIEKLTILLDNCKGEAARALKYYPRKGSSYTDAITQLHEQFHNEEMNTKLLLEQLDKIPQSSKDATQLRATVNGSMAILTSLSRSHRRT